MSGDFLSEAVQLLARVGDLDRIRALHRRGADGRCTHCRTHNALPEPWPCLHITLADRAATLRAAAAP